MDYIDHGKNLYQNVSGEIFEAQVVQVLQFLNEEMTRIKSIPLNLTTIFQIKEYERVLHEILLKIRDNKLKSGFLKFILPHLKVNEEAKTAINTVLEKEQIARSVIEMLMEAPQSELRELVQGRYNEMASTLPGYAQFCAARSSVLHYKLLQLYQMEI